MRLPANLVLLAIVVLIAGGCGAAGKTDQSQRGSATGAETSSASEDFDVSESELGGTAAFRSGFNTCQLYPLSELARQNNVPAKPEAVANAIAAIETTPKDRKDVHDGCLKALRVAE